MAAPQDRTTLDTPIENWAKSVREQDIDGVIAHHAPDILVYDVVAPIRSIGVESYRKAWIEQFFPWASQHGKFQLKDIAVTASDSVAFATGLIECAGIENGEKVEFTLRLTVCFEKRDGSWTFVHEHHSEPIAYEL